MVSVDVKQYVYLKWRMTSTTKILTPPTVSNRLSSQFCGWFLLGVLMLIHKMHFHVTSATDNISISTDNRLNFSCQ